VDLEVPLDLVDLSPLMREGKETGKEGDNMEYREEGGMEDMVVDNTEGNMTFYLHSTKKNR